MKAYFKRILLVINFLIFGLFSVSAQNITVDFHKNDALCISNGTALVQILSSCTGNPTITWHSGSITGPTIGTGNNILNLQPGFYAVEVTDAGCVPYIYNFEIQAPYIELSINTTGSLCSNNANLNAVILGNGIEQATYLWNTGSTMSSIPVSTSGSYTVTVTLGSCTAEAYTTVNNDDFFTIGYNPYICENMNSSAIVNFTDGSPSYNYTYLWSPNGEISQNITINTPGAYSVTVTNSVTGCAGSKNISVGSAPIVNLNLNVTDISCHGMVDGSITANATDGYSSVFLYEWTIMSTSQTIQNLPSGNYIVTVTSEFGCTKEASAFVDEPEQFSYTATQDTGFCVGATASLKVYPTGGTAPYSYYWSDLPNVIYTSFRSIAPLATTSYTVSVVDNNGCTAPSINILVVVSQPITLTPLVTNESCYGSCNGQCILQIQGGVPPLDYSWSSLTNVWDNLCAGSYGVSVVDHYGCSAYTQFEITKPNALMLNIVSDNATCFGYNDGFVQVTASGGVLFPNGDYHYQWNMGQTVNYFNATAGIYTVTVTDANNCSQTATTVVMQPEQIYLTYIPNATICRGEFYETTIYASGGEGPYDFVWHGSDNSTWYGQHLVLYPVQTTEYTVSATDINGCISMQRSATVTVNPGLTIIKLTTSVNKICIGDSVLISLEAEGGNGGPYNFFDKNGNLINPPYYYHPNTTGYYKFRVTDDCGTPAVWDSIFISVMPLPNVAFYSDRLNSCPDEKYLFTEINLDENQTYSWNFGDGGESFLKNPSHTYTEAGLYTVTLNVVDINGCKNKYSVVDMIEIYPYPKADFSTSPDIITIADPYATFENFTIGAVSYFWDYGDGEFSYWNEDIRQVHTYKDVGEYNVTLIAVSEHNCYDTTTKIVMIRDKFTFYAPTIFTPNGDGKNDYFYVMGSGISKFDFELTILDRWGERIYRIDEYNEEIIIKAIEAGNNELIPLSMKWDGTIGKGFLKKGERALPNGIYTWRCKFIDIFGKKHEESGMVLLTR